MDLFQCTKNISHCANLYNLTLCSFDNNVCVEGHGYCVFNERIEPRCLCLPCFIGTHCEEELSKNLWSFYTPYEEIASNGELIQFIMALVFGVLRLLNGILCLQTYLCRTIRKTNLGIYFIMLSIVSIFTALMLLIFSSISLRITEIPQPYLFIDLYCFYSKVVYMPLTAMYNWFIASVAIERVLVECFQSYGLHDSRRRSVISSAIIVIICSLTAVSGIFTVRTNQRLEWRPVHCLNFTPLGYILYATFTRIHLFAFYVIYIAMNILVLQHLFRHRRRFVDSDSLSAHICLILKKHKDFFIPYLIQALSLLPGILMDFMMTCSTANTILIARLDITFKFLQVLPFIITFYLYVYLSPIYWLEFCNSSPIGKCLRKLKQETVDSLQK